MSKSPLPPRRPLPPYHLNRDDSLIWYTYWKMQGQPWRAEPEIDDNRRKYLKECLAIVTDPLQDRYPFKDIALSRADVEWLLATREDEKKSVDLNRSDLRRVDLSSLPLEGADLFGAHLEGAFLLHTHLEGADLHMAHLEGATLVMVHLEGANLREAYLEGATLIGADLSTGCSPDCW